MKNKLFSNKKFKDAFINNLMRFGIINIVGLSFSLLVKLRGDHNGDTGTLYMVVIFVPIFIVSVIIFLVKLFKDIKKYKNVSKTEE